MVNPPLQQVRRDLGLCIYEMCELKKIINKCIQTFFGFITRQPFYIS